MFSFSFWHQRLKRWARAAYRHLRHPRKLKLSAWRRWVGAFALDRRIWRHEKHSTSLGLALGSFVSPIVIPGQMPLAILLACLFRANAPGAVAAAWIGNPVTFPFFLLIEVHLAGLIWPTDTTTGLQGNLKEQMSYLLYQLWHDPAIIAKYYAAGIILGLIMAVLTYFLSIAIFTTWEQFSIKRFPITKPLNRDPKPPEL